MNNKILPKLKVNFNQSIVFIALLLLCVVLSIASPAFLTGKNIMNVLLQSSTNAIIAIGMTMVIITGGIDLSVGSVVAFGCMSMAAIFKAMVGEGEMYPGAEIVGILICIAVGLACGLINGLLIAKAKIAPFITTLGMMSIARGLGLTVSSSRPISEFGPIVRFIGGGKLWVIYVPVIIMIVMIIIASYLLKYTRLGRNIYAIGGNKETARLSGVNVDRVTMLTYVMSGLCCGIVSVILLGRLNSAQPTSGDGYELDVIASTVIGGCSLSGGVGSIIGTLLGALIISVLKNGLNLLGVSSYLQQVITGAVIIGAVLLDSIKRRD